MVPRLFALCSFTAEGFLIAKIREGESIMEVAWQRISYEKDGINIKKTKSMEAIK